MSAVPSTTAVETGFCLWRHAEVQYGTSQQYRIALLMSPLTVDRSTAEVRYGTSPCILPRGYYCTGCISSSLTVLYTVLNYPTFCDRNALSVPCAILDSAPSLSRSLSLLLHVAWAAGGTRTGQQQQQKQGGGEEGEDGAKNGGEEVEPALTEEEMGSLEALTSDTEELVRELKHTRDELLEHARFSDE